VFLFLIKNYIKHTFIIYFLQILFCKCDKIALMNKKNILIVGNYGANNFGDELVLKNILTIFHEGKSCVVSSSPRYTKEHFRVDSCFPFPSGIRSFFSSIFMGRIFKTIKYYATSDMVIFGGGTLFTSEEPITIWIWSVQILPAIILRKKIICFGQGVGEIRGKFSKWIVKKIFSRFDKIILRDRESEKILRAIGVKKEIEIAPDPVFAMKLKKAKGGEILVALRDWKFLQKDFSQVLSEFLEWAYSEFGLKARFLIFDRADQDMSERTAKKITSYKAEITEIDFDNFENVFSKGSFALNFRLHASIICFIMGIPCIGFAYEDKVRRMFQENDKSQYAMGIQDVDVEKIKEKFRDLTRKNSMLK